MLLILLGGCGKTDFQIPEQETEQTETTEETKQIQETAKAKVISRGAWCVYWDTGAVQKAAESLSEYDELILFGCIYDENGDLYIPEQLEQLYEAFPEQGERTTRYLSFINDVIQEDGTAIQKSPEFLARVLKEEQLGNRVIEEMIAQTKAWGLDGVELDYENIDKQENLWQEYLEFVDRLSRRIPGRRTASSGGAGSLCAGKRLFLSHSPAVCGHVLQFIWNPQRSGTKSGCSVLTTGGRTL